MSKHAKISVAQVRQAVGPDLEQLLREVTEAINAAPDGAVIAGSEEVVRDAVARFRQRLYERGIRLRTDAAKADFSPSGRCDGPAAPVQGATGDPSPDGQRAD